MRSVNKKHNYRYPQGKAADRKGMGMELALLVLFAVFACSTLLVSSALIGKDNMNRQETQLKERLLLDQLAESIHRGETPDDTRFADYAAFKWEADHWVSVMNGDGIDLSTLTGEGEGDDVLLITDLSGAPRLTVVLNENKIIRWSYH